LVYKGFASEGLFQVDENAKKNKRLAEKGREIFGQSSPGG
jgi:hypothetical protein